MPFDCIVSDFWLRWLVESLRLVYAVEKDVDVGVGRGGSTSDRVVSRRLRDDFWVRKYRDLGDEISPNIELPESDRAEEGTDVNSLSCLRWPVSLEIFESLGPGVVSQGVTSEVVTACASHGVTSALVSADSHGVTSRSRWLASVFLLEVEVARILRDDMIEAVSMVRGLRLPFESRLRRSLSGPLDMFGVAPPTGD